MVALSQGLETVHQGSQDIFSGFRDSFSHALALHKELMMHMNKASDEVIASHQLANTEVIAVSISLPSLTDANPSSNRNPL